MFELLLNGFITVLQPNVLLAILIGVFWGLIGGALPGITTSTTVALLLPISFYMDTIPALAMLMGAYEAGLYGGSIPAILINAPGTGAAAATVLDGYPLAEQGKAGKALTMAIAASFIGGIIGFLMLVSFAQVMARAAAAFGPPEYFALIFIALTVIGSVSGRSIIKGLCAAILGLALASVGIDPVSGVSRFTFDNIYLADGFTPLSLWIGLFAFAEIMIQLEKSTKELNSRPAVTFSLKDRIKLREVINCWRTIVRGSIIGVLIGALPGIGGGIAAFVSYGEARRKSKHPDSFGKGNIEGVAASESANNSSNGGTLMPLLAFGIPGDLTTAMLLATFLAHGLRPGPSLFVQHLDVIYAIFASMFMAIIINRIVAAGALGILAKLIQVRAAILFPIVLVLCITGSYIIQGFIFDAYAMVFFGVLGYVMRKIEFPRAPLAIAFMLGGMFELSMRQSLAMSHGSISIFFLRPISITLLAVGMFLVVKLVKTQRKSQIARE